jgi:hypothetical protein
MPLTALGGSAGTVVVGESTTNAYAQTLHPNVSAYIAAQASIGYAMTRTEIDAVNNLVWAMVANDLWDKMEVVYPCIGNNAASFKWNLKNTATFNITFFGSWIYASTGMQVAAANAANRGATGYTPSVHQTVGDAHISVYCRNFYLAGVTAPVFGAYGQFSGGGFSVGASSSVAGSADGWVQNTGSGSGRISLSGYSGGMLTASRITSSSVSFSTINNFVRFAALNTPASPPTRVSLQINVGSSFTGTGVMTASQPQEVAFASMGLGLTPQQCRNYYFIVQSFQTALGRQV